MPRGRAAGFEHVSLDLIYGTPGESDADWRRSLDAAVASGPDHLSAYALTVEAGTRLAARVRRGELAVPDDDVLADRYLAATRSSPAGYGWYESPVGSLRPGQVRAQHALLDRRRLVGDRSGSPQSRGRNPVVWNVRHPAAYAARIAARNSPGQAREILSEAERQLEHVMLRIRLAEGCPVGDARPGRAGERGSLWSRKELADSGALAGNRRIVLTRRGRLLADAVTRKLTEP